MQPEAREHAPLTPLAGLIGRISAELGDLAAAVERLHPLATAHARNAIAPAPDAAPSSTAAAPGTGPANTHGQHGAAPAPDYVQAIQDLDHIEQKLRALAGFLADIARTTAPDWRLDPQQALAAITLSDLAARLAGQTPNPAQPPATGELELF